MSHRAVKARIRVRIGRYRGEQGYIISGVDGLGRKVSIFTLGSIGNAQAIAAASRRGDSAEIDRLLLRGGQ